jgi:hypothetical protein
VLRGMRQLPAEPAIGVCSVCPELLRRAGAGAHALRNRCAMPGCSLSLLPGGTTPPVGDHGVVGGGAGGRAPIYFTVRTGLGSATRGSRRAAVAPAASLEADVARVPRERLRPSHRLLGPRAVAAQTRRRRARRTSPGCP